MSDLLQDAQGGSASRPTYRPDIWQAPDYQPPAVLRVGARPPVAPLRRYDLRQQPTVAAGLAATESIPPSRPAPERPDAAPRRRQPGEGLFAPSAAQLALALEAAAKRVHRRRDPALPKPPRPASALARVREALAALGPDEIASSPRIQRVLKLSRSAVEGAMRSLTASGHIEARSYLVRNIDGDWYRRRAYRLIVSARRPWPEALAAEVAESPDAGAPT